MITIGIDPGTTASGVTGIELDDKGNIVIVRKESLPLWEVFDLIKNCAITPASFLIVVENSNLVKGNWHGKSARGNVGKNKAISQNITDYCKHLQVRLVELPPQGYSVTAKNINRFELTIYADRVTNWPNRSNEHERAAYLIAMAGRKRWVLESKKRVNQ